MEFVDIHCHILPDIDDGPQTLAGALAMARLAVEQGIATILATPHQLGNHPGNSAQAIRAAVEKFQKALEVRRIPLRMLSGADIRIEADLLTRLTAGELVTLAERKRHLLLELPHDVFLPLERLLERLRAMGIAGILSHPERNLAILANRELVRPLVDRGCLLQVTAGSLLGKFGAAARSCAEWLVERGLVHVIATDAHDSHRRPPDLRAAFDRLVQLAGVDMAKMLCCDNPARIAAGEAALAAPRSRRRLLASLWPW